MNLNSTARIAISTMGVLAALPPSTYAKQPNILFILADDLGWNDLGCMGSNYYETPNIDRLSQSGITFTNAYSACQVSSPSRASILTGKYPSNHGVTNFIGAPSGEDWRKKNRFTKMLPPEYELHLRHEESTLPEYLREAGYKTLFAGKWHLGDRGSSPEDHGFDVNIGGWASGGPKGGYFSPWSNPKLPNQTKGENLSMRLSKESVELIAQHTNENKETPFFAFVSFYAVHSPIQTTEQSWRHFRDKAEKMGVQERGFAIDRAMPVRQHQDNPVYAGLIQQLDDAVGHLLNSLTEMGLDNETLVIFTSDNGGVVSGDNFSTSLKPLRGGKGMQFEGGIRIPLIIRVPNSEVNTTRCDTPVSGIDYYPTIVEYAGLSKSPDQKVDGVSITPLFKGKKIASRPLFWHYPHYGNQGGEPSAIIREGDWKLIRYYEDGRRELYNLASDISESQDLAEQHPERVNELDLRLNEWLKETNATMPTKDPQYSPQKEAELKNKWRTTTLKTKERERSNMLRVDWSPNATWWGSKITID